MRSEHLTTRVTPEVKASVLKIAGTKPVSEYLNEVIVASLENKAEKSEH